MALASFELRLYFGLIRGYVPGVSFFGRSASGLIDRVVHGCILLSYILGVFGPWNVDRAAAVENPAIERTKSPLTIEDTITSRQVVSAFGPVTHEEPILLSPDGSRYLLVTIRGDLERNGNWIEFFGGRSRDLQETQASRLIAQLFTAAKSRNPFRTKSPRWIGNNSIAFVWDDSPDSHRVVQLDLTSGAQTEVIRSATSISAFDVDKNGEEIVYAALPEASQEKWQAMLAKGFAVTDQQVDSLLKGVLDGEEPWSKPQFFIKRRGGRVVNISTSERRTLLDPMVSMSPTGAYAIVTAPPGAIPGSWSRYDEHSPDLIGIKSLAPGIDRRPTVVSQYWLVDIGSATAMPLINAPRGRTSWSRIVWSPDGTSAMIGPTFAPVGTGDALGLRGKAILTVNLKSKKITNVPLTEFGERPVAGFPDELVHPLYWDDNNVIGVGNGASEMPFTWVTDHWVRARFRLPRRAKEPSPISLALRQSLNDPPVLYATNRHSGKDVRILELNPELRSKTLGNVQIFRWKDRANRGWSGTLYLPVGFKPGRTPIPLVVQLAGASISAREFSLLGANLLTGFAAQPLANVGIGVLNLYEPDAGLEGDALTSRGPEIVLDGVESAVRELVDTRLVDPTRVGLFGFSITGYYVQYILSHTSFKYAAANVCDNLDASYFQYILADDEARAEFAELNGASPYRDGLKQWLDRSPGFLTELVSAPLRLERDQGGGFGLLSALYSWETFSLMRARGQPVELYFVPDVTHGEHILEGPAQQLASRSGTVDWFDFWLNGKEMVDARKSEQYERWNRLRRRSPNQISSATAAADK